MERENKRKILIESRWWNPLFWLVVFLAPVAGIVAGILAGGFTGLMCGYEKGLEYARRKMHEINRSLP